MNQRGCLNESGHLLKQVTIPVERSIPVFSQTSWENDMNTAELRRKASAVGVRHANYFVSDCQLVHAIQKACRHSPCFLSENRMLCDEVECEWREECKKLVAAWKC